MAVSMQRIQERIRVRAWILPTVLVPFAAVVGWQVGKVLWFHVMAGTG